MQSRQISRAISERPRCSPAIQVASPKAQSAHRRFLPAPAVLAAASLPLLAPPFGVRPALAIDVPTCSLQLVHVHATMLHNFHLDRIGAWSYVNMAKLFVRYELA